MKRADIDRWTEKRTRATPPPKGFIIRRGQANVEAFTAEEHAEVSGFCKPGDVILAIMPDDTVGLTLQVTEDPTTAESNAGLMGSTLGHVIRVVSEQIGKSNEGITAAYETLLATYRDELKRNQGRIEHLEQKLESAQSQAIELVRLEHDQKLEESRLNHNQAMTKEYLGRAFEVLDQVVDGFLKHHGRREKLKGIFEKLKPETLTAIMGDLSERDINDLMAIADDLDKEATFSSKPKLPVAGG